MALTLTANISATVHRLQVTGSVPSEIGPGYTFRLDDELMTLVNFVSVARVVNRNKWFIQRGQGEFIPAAHTAGATVYGTRDGFVAGTDEDEPDPFAAGGGSGIPQGGPLTEDLDADGNTITNLAPGVASTDAATVGQLGGGGVRVADFLFTEDPSAGVSYPITAVTMDLGVGYGAVGIAGDHAAEFPDSEVVAITGSTGNDGTYSAHRGNFVLTGVNQGTKTFTVAEDITDLVVAGLIVVIIGSTGNDGPYTVVSATFDTDHTDVVVVEAVPDATVDGNIITPSAFFAGGTTTIFLNTTLPDATVDGDVALTITTTYTAAMEIVAGTTVLDVILLPLAGWAAFPGGLTVSDDLSGNGSYYDGPDVTNLAPYDPTSPIPNDNYDCLQSAGESYEDAGLLSVDGDPSGIGVYYSAGDTLTLSLVTQNVPPVTPTGSLLVRVLYLPPVTPTAATPT